MASGASDDLAGTHADALFKTHFLMLAIHARRVDIKWLPRGRIIESHPALDWQAVLERAHRQGCVRMILLAAALAKKFFHAEMPDDIFHAVNAD